MPTLTWIGKDKVVNHHHDVPYRVLVRLVPEHPQALQDSIDAILQADIIVIGPGSLYTSIIPNFLVDGICEAIRASGAVREYILNIMMQDGETDLKICLQR